MSRHKKISAKLATFAVIMLILVGVIGFIFINRSRNQNSTSQQLPNADTPETTETRPASSEGSTFDVPSEVDDEAIKDYKLVTENEQFKIRSYDENYIISLYAIINNPSQYDQYRDQLREYKQNALTYLKNTGIDVNKVKITYEPSEATDL